MLRQHNDHMHLPAVKLTRSYTKDSDDAEDAGDDLESPPTHTIHYTHNKPAFLTHGVTSPLPSSSSALSLSSTVPSQHSHSRRRSSKSQQSVWSTVLSCALTAVVTACVVLLYVNNTSGLVTVLPSHTSIAAAVYTPAAAAAPGASLDSAHLLGVSRADSRSLLSVQPAAAAVAAAASSFPSSHIPSVATAVSTNVVPEASLTLFRNFVSAGRLVDTPPPLTATC